MKIIIAPAKKMVIEEVMEYKSIPSLMDKTKPLFEFLKNKSVSELQEIYKCNLDIASENYTRFKHMKLDGNLSPALFTYDGIQYKHLSPNTLDLEALDYLNDHLRILSGFYGVVKPLDGITPYRLEMQTKLKGFVNESLYDYYGSSIYKELNDHIILNLASAEYSKCVEKYLTKEDMYITVSFLENVKGSLKTKATLAKMARGEMVRYLAIIKAQVPEDAKGFNGLGFKFSEELSNDLNYVFVKE